MPQAVPLIEDVIVEYAGTYASVAAYVVAAAAIVLINKFAQKKAGSGQLPINVTVRSTVAPRKIALGTRRLSGSIIFVGLSGPNNKYLYYVVAWAGNTRQMLADLWLD